MAESSVGVATYCGSSFARQPGPARTRLRMTYTARLGAHEIARGESAFDCWNATAVDVAAEAQAAGLAATIGDDLDLLGRAPGG